MTRIYSATNTNKRSDEADVVVWEPARALLHAALRPPAVWRLQHLNHFAGFQRQLVGEARYERVRDDLRCNQPATPAGTKRACMRARSGGGTG